MEPKGEIAIDFEFMGEYSRISEFSPMPKSILYKYQLRRPWSKS